MVIEKKDRSKALDGLLLLAGFVCQLLPRLLAMEWADSLCTFGWMYAYLTLTCRRRDKISLAVTGAAFVLGFNLNYLGVFGSAFGVNLAVFTVFGAAIYGVMLLSSWLMNKWRSFWSTLIFPTVWMMLYVLATVIRFPALVRVDMMFTDMRVLIQSERLIGSFGLSFAILWMVSLVRYAVWKKQLRWGVVCITLFCLLMLPGIINLMPNITGAETIRVAYTTGPYGGDFMHYQSPGYAENEASLKRSAEAAAAEQADMLVFCEEAFELADVQESAFVAQCAALADENRMAMLVGLDVKDTDGSHQGKGENKLVFIGADGQVLGSYQKSNLLPILESDYEPGDGTIPSHTLDIRGRKVKISYLICYDSNFPSYVKKVEQDTDILFLPSWDWAAITELHSHLCRAAAIESGMAILKPTYDGISIAVNPDGEVFHTSDTAQTGYETVQLVEMPIKSTAVIDRVYEQHDPFIFAIIGTEIMAGIICILLIVANVFVSSEQSKRTRWFTAMVGINLAGNLADAASWLLDGCVRLTPIIWGTSLVAMLLSFAVIGAFASYLTAFAGERGKISHAPMYMAWGYVVLSMVVTVITSLNGSLYTITNGVYAAGPLYDVYVAANVGMMAFGIGVIFVQRKLHTRYDQIVLYVYMLIPVLAAVLNMFVEEFSFAYPSMTLSMVLIYVMLQTDRVERIAHEGQLVSHYAMHDDLTGLNNRRAFRQRTEQLKVTDGTSGVIFGDLNGLKYANDNFGHEAGDKLLIQYAQLLAGIFRLNEIYRISGNEFICMMENVEETTFNARVKALQDRLGQDEQPLACIGAAFGSNGTVDSLVHQAEAIMYAEKEIFHEKFPKTKR
ncbi:MAG: diguanylate cyclase [Clostridia bacterium]|nr:diguanylate cyclase [Clostridia bacterium]